ncbi:hypothetical protein O3M35_008301 [Rhynocoris fuscipes]|uniref:COX assembly mitochondrial protein n=1 Tax=Rhynocoris fuscipes TaxID=488301 RepID=A0AAW1D5U1_9HEMI
MVNNQQEIHSSTPLPIKNKGPHGLGDPEDRSLRKVELEVVIPQKMREKARSEKCSAEVEDFNQCCLANGYSMVFKCRNENNKMKSCLSKWYQNDEFRRECTEEYLKERSDFRRTGIPIKRKISR